MQTTVYIFLNIHYNAHILLVLDSVKYDWSSSLTKSCTKLITDTQKHGYIQPEAQKSM